MENSAALREYQKCLGEEMNLNIFCGKTVNHNMLIKRQHIFLTSFFFLLQPDESFYQNGQ